MSDQESCNPQHSDPQKPGQDEITLVAGDADYVPVIEDLVSAKFRFEVVFWEHASHELKSACSRFMPVNPYLEHLRLK